MKEEDEEEEEDSFTSVQLCCCRESNRRTGVCQNQHGCRLESGGWSCGKPKLPPGPRSRIGVYLQLLEREKTRTRILRSDLKARIQLKNAT